MTGSNQASCSTDRFITRLLKGCGSLLIVSMIAGSGTIMAGNGEQAESSGLKKEERDSLVQYLQETRRKLWDEVAGLSEAQMKFKPGVNRWSIAEITEHLAIAENTVYSLVTEKIMKSPARPELKGEKGPRLKDVAIVMAITNRAARRFTAPEIVRPKSMFATGTEAISGFDKARAKTIAYAETVTDDLRCHFADNPVFGAIDAYQWLLFIGAHTERHLEQIAEVKSDPRFPRK